MRKDYPMTEVEKLLQMLNSGSVIRESTPPKHLAIPYTPRHLRVNK